MWLRKSNYRKKHLHRWEQSWDIDVGHLRMAAALLPFLDVFGMAGFFQLQEEAHHASQHGESVLKKEIKTLFVAWSDAPLQIIPFLQQYRCPEWPLTPGTQSPNLQGTMSALPGFRSEKNIPALRFFSLWRVPSRNCLRPILIELKDDKFVCFYQRNNHERGEKTKVGEAFNQ